MKKREYIPKYVRRNILYNRLEDDGSEYISLKNHPEARELIFNNTAIIMLNSCNGTRTIDEILEILENKYNTNRARLEFDLAQLLLNSWRMGLIEWIGENPFLYLYRKESDGVNYSFLHDEEIKTALQQSSIQYINPYIQYDYNFNDEAISQFSFSFIDNYFLIKWSEESGILLVLRNVSAAEYVKVELIAVYGEKKDIHTMYLSDEFLNWCCDRLALFLKKDINSIVFEDADNKEIIEFFQRSVGTRFIFRGTLLQDTKNKQDIHVYQYMCDTELSKKEEIIWKNFNMIHQ